MGIILNVWTKTMKKPVFFLLLASVFSFSTPSDGVEKPADSAWSDDPFVQHYSIKYHLEGDVDLTKVIQDRNGSIQLLSPDGLYRPHAGQFLYPIQLLPDRTYLPVADKGISGLGSCQNQFVADS